MWASMKSALRRLQGAHQLFGQPSRREEIQDPSQLGTTGVEPLDAGQERGAETRIGRHDRANVDADAADPRGVERLEFGIGDILVDVDDPPASGQLAHGVEHAGVVTAVGARLDEHPPLEPEPSREREEIGERRQRGFVTKIRSVGITFGGAEDVKVAVAGQRRRLQLGLGFMMRWHGFSLLKDNLEAPQRAAMPCGGIRSAPQMAAGSDPARPGFCKTSPVPYRTAPPLVKTFFLKKAGPFLALPLLSRY